MVINLCSNSSKSKKTTMIGDHGSSWMPRPVHIKRRFIHFYILFFMILRGSKPAYIFGGTFQIATKLFRNKWWTFGSENAG